MKRFGSNGGEIKTCGSDRDRSKQERIEDAKNNLKRYKRELKKFNKHMNSLRSMHSTYDYNHNHLAELVGACFMQIDRHKGWLESEERILKSLQKKKEK